MFQYLLRIKYNSIIICITKSISWSCLLIAFLYTSSQAAPGDLDTSFGNDGIVTISQSENEFTCDDIAIQSDGKILVTGSYNNLLLVLRHNTDGSLDTGFGSDGIVTASIPEAAYVRGESIAIQTDGKILSAGFYVTGGQYSIAIMRFNTDGSLDTSFSTDGIVTTDISNQDELASTIAIQDDGKILAGGCSWGFNQDFTIVRYNTDGSLDTNFGTDGIVSSSFNTEYDCISSIVIQDDGKILAVGTEVDETTGMNNSVIARYQNDGSLDTSFGNDGIISTSLPEWDFYGNDIAVQSDGRILVTGEAADNLNSEVSYLVIRYNNDGSLDTSFGNDGIVTTKISDSAGIGYSISIQTDGKILVTGYHNNGFAVIRYNTEGSLDTSFGDGGIVTTDISDYYDISNSIVIQSDGKILVAGTSGIDREGTNDFDISIVRYIASSSLSINGITVESTGCIISNVTIPEIPAGAPSGFNTDEIVSFTATDVHTNAAVSITFESLPADASFYKIINGSWIEIYPANESNGITGVELNGNTLSYTIADNSDCDEDSATGTIIDPIAVGTITESTTASGGGGSGCFIATAAYGSYDNKHVKILRQFRDRFLIKNRFGKVFVSLYYKYSPPVSDYISGNEALKAAVRLSLYPIVGLSWIAINHGTTALLVIIGFFIAFLIIFLRRHRCWIYKYL